MDIDKLRYFQTIARSGSLRSAADLLGLSPAALSKAMKILSAETQIEFFAPSGRGIVLTDAAWEFAKRIEPLMSEYEKLLRNPRAASSTARRMRVASFEVFTTHLMGPLVEEFFPDYEWALHELVPGHIEEAVSNDTVDYGITYIPLPHPALDHLKVLTLKMGLFGKADKFAEMDLSEIPFVAPITPVQGSPTKVRGLDGWPDDQMPRFIKYRCEMLETALEFCRRGLAIAYLPKFVVALHNQTVRPALQLKELKNPARNIKSEQAVYLVKRKSLSEGPELKRLAKALRILCKID